MKLLLPILFFSHLLNGQIKVEIDTSKSFLYTEITKINGIDLRVKKQTLDSTFIYFFDLVNSDSITTNFHFISIFKPFLPDSILSKLELKVEFPIYSNISHKEYHSSIYKPKYPIRFSYYSFWFQNNSGVIYRDCGCGFYNINRIWVNGGGRNMRRIRPTVRKPFSRPLFEQYFSRDLILEGYSSFYKNRQLKDVFLFKNGFIDSTFVSYHPNGNIKIKANFKNGLLNGDFIYKDSNSKIIAEAHFINNKLKYSLLCNNNTYKSNSTITGTYEKKMLINGKEQTYICEIFSDNDIHQCFLKERKVIVEIKK